MSVREWREMSSEHLVGATITTMIILVRFLS